MSIPRPKILTAFTTAALTLRTYITDSVKYDTTMDVSIAAGTYFVAWDAQSDDFLLVLANALTSAMLGSGIGGYDDAGPDDRLFFEINSIGNVVMRWRSGTKDDIRVAWTEQDGATVGGILGFDTSADLDFDSGTYRNVGDYKHAYGWYAEEDGQLRQDLVEDADVANALQSRAISGQVKTQYLDSVFENMLGLNYLDRDLTFSNGVSYTSAAVYPYERNKGLECWWREARTGVRFRVYRDNTIDFTKAQVRGSMTAGTDTDTIEDTGKSWDTDPQEHAGKLVIAKDTSADPDELYRYYVDSNTATLLELPNDWNSYDINTDTSDYAIFDQPYRTYVADINKMNRFSPTELPNIDRYAIDIPVLKYTA
jgi:hypothetical protein